MDPNIKNNLISTFINHYNILGTIEDHFHLRTLGRNDTISFSSNTNS